MHHPTDMIAHTKTFVTPIVLFNVVLNTFYLWLYGVGHMAKDYSDSKRRNLILPLHRLLSISSKGSFICTIPQTGHSLHQVHNQKSNWGVGW